MYPLLFHENDMNLLNESVHSIKKNTQVLSMTRRKLRTYLCPVNKMQDKIQKRKYIFFIFIFWLNSPQ